MTQIDMSGRRMRQLAVFPDRQWEQTAYGLYIPKRQKRPKRWPVAIDLFCGAGGFSLGTMKAGFHVIAAADWDEWAAMTYTYNLGTYPMTFHYIELSDGERMEKAVEKEYKAEEKKAKKAGRPPKAITTGSGWRHSHPDVPGVEHFFLGDIRKLTGQQILDAIGMERGEVDLVMGGPPCQGFSTAGKRDVLDPRNSLVFEFARLVVEISPKTMVFENVPGILDMVTPEGLPVVDAFCRVLVDGGFSTLDALKKSLTYDLDARAAISKSSKGERQESYEEEAEPSAQLSLF